MEAAILRCLEKNPAQRFQGIGELEAALAGVTQPAGPPAPPLPAPAQMPPAAASITPPAPQRAVASPAPISVTPHPQTGAMAAPASSSSRRLLTLAVILVVAAGAYLLGRMNKPDEAAPPAPAAEVSPSTAPPAARVSPAPPPATLPPARPAAEAKSPVKTETKTAAPPPTAPASAPVAAKSAPATLADVKALFIEPMEDGFDKVLTAEINKQLGADLVVVPARQMADAVLKGSGEWEKGRSSILGTRQTASASVTMVTRRGEKELWSGQAGDRAFLRGGGPRRVAERLVRDLKKALGEARKPS